MAAKLSSGAGLVAYETLDSTNAEARRRAEAGERGPLWLLALEQTAGYGRRGAAWSQSPGDIAATLLFAPNARRDDLGQLSFVAALAVAEAIGHYAPRARIALKWPNDVLVSGGKIAGILLELLGGPAAPPLIALGVGVNIVSKPERADYPTARLIDLLDGAGAPAPAAFVETLDAALAGWIARWRKEGFEPVRAAWLEKAARLGEKISVRLPNETVEGVFRDLDLAGALVLDCESGRRLISAGAVLPAALPRSGA